MKYVEKLKLVEKVVENFANIALLFWLVFSIFYIIILSWKYFQVGILTANEAELFNSVKRWLGDVNERILIHVIKVIIVNSC